MRERGWFESAETSGRAWKSGALAPRQETHAGAGFSPTGPQGLKAIASRRRNAALKGDRKSVV